MSSVRTAFFVLLMACSVSTAWAQYGMYGSPDTLPVPQPAQNSCSQVGYETTQDPYTAQPVGTSPAPMPDAPSLQCPGATAPAPAAQNKVYTDGNGPCPGVAEEFGYGGGCQQGACCPWYASVSALVMNRSMGPGVWTSYNLGNLKEQGNSTQMNMAWEWGGEVDFGRTFCCCGTPYAIEASYWTTESLTGSSSASYAGSTVGTVLDFGFLTFKGLDANSWFSGVPLQTLQRRDEFHDVELNLIRERVCCACDSPWDVNWSVGMRYFRFQDRLNYDTLKVLGAYGTDNEAYMNTDVSNNFVGFQTGFDAAYCFCHGVRLYIKPRVGIYDNILNSNFDMELGDHSALRYNSAFGVSYPQHFSNNCLSFLTQMNVGGEWQISQHWSAKAGYRVLAATGVAYAEGQWPASICDVPEMQKVGHANDLVLHGAFIGVTCCF